METGLLRFRNVFASRRIPDSNRREGSALVAGFACYPNPTSLSNPFNAYPDEQWAAAINETPIPAHTHCH